jgi:hypothetical protein
VIPKELKPGAVWERHVEGSMVPERITIVTASTTTDTFRRIAVTYRTEGGTGEFYGLLESWHCQFSPMPSD